MKPLTTVIFKTKECGMMKGRWVWLLVLLVGAGLTFATSGSAVQVKPSVKGASPSAKRGPRGPRGQGLEGRSVRQGCRVLRDRPGSSRLFKSTAQPQLWGLAESEARKQAVQRVQLRLGEGGTGLTILPSMRPLHTTSGSVLAAGE
jgi:hypothetical protein